VRLLRGSHILMEQTRVDGGIWMPERVEVHAAAKIFFVKSLVIDRVLTYSEYALPQAGVPATRDPVVSRQSSLGLTDNCPKARCYPRVFWQDPSPSNAINPGTRSLTA